MKPILSLPGNSYLQIRIYIYDSYQYIILVQPQFVTNITSKFINNFRGYIKHVGTLAHTNQVNGLIVAVKTAYIHLTPD